ncbi:MAG TPA: FkbM family methyltransferase [Bacteroidia bacterium]|nr:FkbM family methyltransferase [Bacteroidia bacterium]
MKPIKLIIRLILNKDFFNIYKRRKLINSPAFFELQQYPKIINLLTQTTPFFEKYIYDKRKKLIYFPQTDIGNLLYATGKFENEEIAYSSKLLDSYEGGIVLDIGANVGLHVITWARTHRKHKFYAFEPSITVGRVLVESVKRNLLQNRVTVINKAVSNKNGNASFFETTDDAYNSLKDTKRKNIHNVYNVDVISIDDFVSTNKIESIRFIKIDTEGFENEVIEGASETIKKQMPDFFIEIYKGVNSNINPEETVKKMIEVGYNAYVYKDGKLHSFQKHDDRFYNYFFSKNSLNV